MMSDRKPEAPESLLSFFFFSKMSLKELRLSVERLKFSPGASPQCQITQQQMLMMNLINIWRDRRS